MAMPLPKPDDKDLAKLHSEINQYINHRFVIATTAITITGVVLGWIVVGPSSGSGLSGQAPQVREVAFFSALSLSIILVVLYAVSQIINRSISKITSYLLITDSSTWEKIYRKLEEKGGIIWSGQEESLGLVFGTLGLLAGLTPLVLAVMLGANQGTMLGAIRTLWTGSLGVRLLIVFTSLYELIIVCNTIKNWRRSSFARAEERWRELEKQLDAEEKRGAEAMWTLDDIVASLNEHRQRASYGAVADVLGVAAIGLMKDRPKSHEDSWVVAATNDKEKGRV